MSTGFKERRSITEGLKPSKDCHSTQEALKYYDRDPECVGVALDVGRYTKRKSRYKVGVGLKEGREGVSL